LLAAGQEEFGSIDMRLLILGGGDAGNEQFASEMKHRGDAVHSGAHRSLVRDVADNGLGSSICRIPRFARRAHEHANVRASGKK
jgi:hypothetical protein